MNVQSCENTSLYGGLRTLFVVMSTSFTFSNREVFKKLCPIRAE